MRYLCIDLGDKRTGLAVGIDGKGCGSAPDPKCSIAVGNLSGCGRQISDALSYLPVLFVAFWIGLAVLILQFWLANWNPGCLSGAIAILSFAALPMTALGWWSWWRASERFADAVLTVRRDGLEITSLGMPTAPLFIPWQRLDRIRERVFTMYSRVLTITFSTDAGAMDRRTVQFLGCVRFADFCVFMDCLDRTQQVGRNLGDPEALI